MKTIVWFGFVLGALSAAGEVFVTKLGKAATLECGVKAYTNSLTWSHGENLIIGYSGKSGFPRKGTIDLVGRSKVKGQTNLAISPVKEEDAGKFVCIADGRRQEHTVLVVSVSASPPGDLRLGSVATLQCRVKGLDPHPAVQWKKPGGSPHSEHSQTAQLKSVALSDAGNWECSFTHEGVTYSESLAIVVQAPAPETVAPSQSSKEVLKPTCHSCDTHPPQLLLGLDWWAWVAVGVGCLVVVLLIVGVIVMCKRIKRRKRKFQTMKNGRQPLKHKKYCQCDLQAAAAKPQQGRRREKPSAPPLQPLLMQ